MATKISKVNAERLKKLGITANTEDEAKKILIERLEQAGIPGMDEETIDNLIDIVGSFAELESDSAEEAAPAEEPTPAEQQADELAEEAAEEEEEAAQEAEEAAPAEEPTPAEQQADELAEEAAEEEEEAAQEAEEAAPAEPEAEPEPEESKPQPKAKKPAAKKEAKPKKTKTTKKPSKRDEKGIRLKPQTNPEHLDLLRKELSKFFPEKEFQYVAVSQGISIKFGGANSHPVAIMFENVYSKDGQFATTNVVLNTFRSQASQDKLAEDGLDFVMTWNNLPWLKGIAWNDAMEVVKTYLDDIKSAVSTADTRLGKNREKMEADLKATGKKAAAPAAKKPAPATKKVAPKAEANEPAEDPKAKARAALMKAAAAKKAKAAKK